MMRSSAGIGLMLVIAALVAPWTLVITVGNAAPTCNGTLPEDPAPSCGAPYLPCEGINPTSCPVGGKAGCNATTGQYPEKVPTSCETVGGSNLCRNGTNDTICQYTYPCRLGVQGPNGKPVCTSVATEPCTVTYVTPKVSANCMDGG